VNFKTHADGLHYADLNAAFVVMLSVVTQSVVVLTVAAAQIRILRGFLD
jgi:hypothetical protein